MQSQTSLHLPLAIRVAHAITRLITWGMPADERGRLLMESLADWEAMAGDHGSGHVLWRAVRGIPAGIWVRLSERDTTAMPAGIAITLVGIGGVAAGSLSMAYPAPFRQFVVVTSLGLVLVGHNLLRQPRRLVLRSYRAAGTLVAAGFLGLATRLPTAAQWPYDTPPPQTELLDLALRIAFLLIAIGFGALVAASLVRRRHWLVPLAGIGVLAGVATLACTQIVWGIWAAPTDMRLAASALVSGLAALSFAHVVPRLRRLDIVTHGEDEECDGRTNTTGRSAQ